MRKKVIKRAINFDLDTKELLKHFKNTHQAYSSIKKFMEENGFEHRQYSGYISSEPMSTLLLHPHFLLKNAITT